MSTRKAKPLNKPAVQHPARTGMYVLMTPAEIRCTGAHRMEYERAVQDAKEYVADNEEPIFICEVLQTVKRTSPPVEVSVTKEEDF